MFKPPYFHFNFNKAECPPSSDKGMLSPTIKGTGRKTLSEIDIYFFFIENEDGLRCYLKGTRFFDRGSMIAGPSPRSARWPIGIAAFGLCLPENPARPGKALATTERKGSM